MVKSLKNSFCSEHILLGILVIGATIMWQLGTDIYMQDELSALSRLDFDSFKDVLYKGIREDGHPAFVHSFLWIWTKVGGLSPWWVKLPSLLCALGSIFLSFRIANRHIGPWPALSVASYLAFSQYFILYFGLARPYAFGVFFILWQLDSILKIRSLGFKPKIERNPVPYSAFILSSILAAWTHYFSLMLAGILAVFALVGMKKELRKSYFISSLIAVGIWSIHLPITLYQLNKGGVGGENGWLAAPDQSWLIDYLGYLAMYQKAMLILASLLLVRLIWSLRSLRAKGEVTWLQWLGLFALTIPFSIGFLYSQKVSPVLQFSVLIFGIPLFLMALFSVFSDWPKTVQKLLFLSLCVFSLYGSIYQRKHFELYAFQPYQTLSEEIEKMNKRGETPLVITDLNEGFLKPYIRTKGIDYLFAQSSDTLKNNLTRILRTEQALMMSIGPREEFRIIEKRFPEQAQVNSYPNYSILTWNQKPNFINKKWNLSNVLNEGENRAAGQEYGASGQIELNEFPKFPYIELFVQQNNILPEVPDLQGTVVTEIYQRDSLIHWQGRDISTHGYPSRGGLAISSTLNLQDILQAFQRPQEFDKSIPVSLKTYYWHRDQQAVELGSLELDIYSDRADRYSLFHPIPQDILDQ